MPSLLEIRKIDKIIADDLQFRFTFSSYILILVIYINLNFSKSFVLGFVTFVLYFWINGTFLANVFFQNESLFMKLAFGFLALIMLLGFVGWLVMLVYNLDTPLFLLTLIVTATLSSLLNWRRKRKNATR